MAKLVCVSAVVLMGLSSTLGAWGQAPSMPQNQVSPDVHFPLNPQQAWALEESLLVWKAYEDDTDYAVSNSADTVTTTLTRKTARIKHPTFDWSTGVRLKLTRYVASHDLWDINFLGTYYYSQGENHTKVDPASLISGASPQNSIRSPWERELFGIAATAKSHVQLNFFNFDMTFGRCYSLTPKVDIHPFIGIRSLLLYQSYKASYSSTTDVGVPAQALVLNRNSFKGEHNFWAVGPRVGVDLAMHVGKHWSFVAAFGGSLFAGRSGLEEEFKGVLPLAPGMVIANGEKERLNDKDSLLRSNLDASIGLGWEKWLNNDTVRIAPSFVFEVSEWFAVKRWVALQSSTNTTFLQGQGFPNVKSLRRYSDLGLMGFNVNLQVDF